MGIIVIASFKAKEDKESELKELMISHHTRLLTEDLVTSRKPIIMQSNDDTFLEVFEWKSKEAIEDAHKNENVLKMWSEFEQICDYTKLNSLSEIDQMFPEFNPIN